MKIQKLFIADQKFDKKKIKLIQKFFSSTKHWKMHQKQIKFSLLKDKIAANELDEKNFLYISSRNFLLRKWIFSHFILLVTIKFFYWFDIEKYEIFISIFNLWFIDFYWKNVIGISNCEYGCWELLCYLWRYFIEFLSESCWDLWVLLFFIWHWIGNCGWRR